MAVLDLNECRVTLRTRLLTITTLPAIRAWENRRTQTPDATSKTMFIAERQIVLDETKDAIGCIHSMVDTRYDVMYPKGAGTQAPEDMAKLVAEAFEPGQSLQGNNGLEIALYKVRRLPLMQDPDDPAWWMFPVVSSWRAFTPSNP